MKETLSLYLSKKDFKPIFSIFINNIEVVCMYDSGAITSVWVSSQKRFNRIFPDAIKHEKPYLLGGFGGSGRAEHDMYKIPHFIFGNVKFNNFPIVTEFNRNFGCDLIFGSGLFKDAKIVVDRLSEKHTISYQFGKDEYNIGIILHNNSVADTYVFTQDTL